MRVVAAIVVACLAMPAYAQQAAKERKDFLIEAFTAQRDTASRDAAACYADASVMIAKLTAEGVAKDAEIAQLKAAAEKKPEPPAQ